MPSILFNHPSTTSEHSPKLNVTHSQIQSTYLDPSQPPLKRTPFRQIRSVPFVRDFSVCIPRHVYSALYDDERKVEVFESGIGPGQSQGQRQHIGISNRQLKYTKIIMTLSDILTDYNLRTSNHLMLSQTPLPASNAVSMHLNSGTLTLTLPHTIYERSGLTFTTTQISNGDRKHDKRSQLYRMVIDFRQPSMIKGKKGFDRLLYAAPKMAL